MPTSPQPRIGQFVSLRGRLWLVEGEPDAPFEGLSLACVDDDASGEGARVLWGAEVDPRLRDEEAFGDKLRWPGAGYYAMHGFSHALMNEIALDCGYPATALKERLYAIVDADAERFGLLIYTATIGAQGTLGGLIATLPRLGAIAERALDKLALCSGDPICAEHDPDADAPADERSLSGAACHSCLLLAETSCEARNLYLDRALAVATVSTPDAALFGP